jgi:hypothetical protein
MNIPRVIAAALELSARLQVIGLPYCFIGGIAVQRWGQPRLTVDADATLLTGWDNEATAIDALLIHFAGRIPNARTFALEHRILLLQSSDGTHLDIALGALPFEERSIERSTPWPLPDGTVLITCSAEDLIVHKSFASRDHDWADIEGVLMRQGRLLNTDMIMDELRPLAAMKEDPSITRRLETLMDKLLQ